MVRAKKTDEFQLTPKQQEAALLLAGPQLHTLLAGGSRSGKTFQFTLATITRAVRAALSRHAILRFRLGHIKQSIVLDTFPKVMRTVYPSLDYQLNKSDLYASLPNGAEIWFGGLDDKERVEKILGNEYATIYFNECSQIPLASRNTALTRLAQLVYDNDGKILPLRAYYDENPPTKGHWTYKEFLLKTDPETRRSLPNPENYAYLQMNPKDNAANLNPAYLKTLEQLPPRLRKRFLEGEFGDATPNALFTEETIEKWRVVDQELPEMLLINISVDPSGADDTDNIDNDEIGITAQGLGTDGNVYLFEDLTCKVGPATWGRIATQAYERHEADRIVGEENFGGAMVKHVIHTARPNTPYRSVRASRGKHVRAEPVAALFETGKVRIVGELRELEDELCGFTTHGYMGERSPNRADAAFWGISDLLPNLFKHEDEPKQIIQPRISRGANSWMRRMG